MSVRHHRTVPVSTGLGLMWPGGRKHRAGRSAVVISMVGVRRRGGPAGPTMQASNQG
jgi:hypothetical protein